MIKKATLVVGLAALVLVILYANPLTLSQSLLLMNTPLFLSSLLLSLLVLLLMVLRFGVILSFRATSIRRLFAIHTLTNLIGHVSPGRSGEFLKAYLLKKKESIPYVRGVSVVVIEKLEDILTMTTLSLILIILIFGFGSSEFLVSTIPLLVLIVVAIALAYNERLLRFIVRFLPFKLRTALYDAQKTFKKNLYKKLLISSFIITVIAQILSASRMVIIFMSLGVEGPFLLIILIFFLSLIIGILSLIPGGFGSVELSGIVLYTTFLGIDIATATLALILLRVSTFAVDIPAGVAGNWLMGTMQANKT